MTAHKFKVGQTVIYTPGRMSMTASGAGYKVVRLMPAAEGQNQYRIKSSSENFERVAKEGDLSLR